MEEIKRHSEPVPNESAELDSLRDTYNKLLGVHQTLREEAESQGETLRYHRRLYAASTYLTQSYQWRHYALCRELFGPPDQTVKPPKEIPVELLEQFTVDGKMAVESNYLDCTYPSNWPLIYTDYEIDRYLAMLKRGETFIYGMTDEWVWQAIEKYPIKDCTVVNMGSLTPWYESTCIYFGARPTTIDYNTIITRTDRIETMTVGDWDRTKPTFDFAWSISSFEHDGLGMYGDPLDPHGDLKAMEKMKRIVKPGGLLFLSVPVGKDKILFNNARIYGRVRLPMLCEGWKQLETFGLEPEHFEGPGHIQPIIVLRNSG